MDEFIKQLKEHLRVEFIAGDWNESAYVRLHWDDEIICESDSVYFPKNDE